MSCVWRRQVTMHTCVPVYVGPSPPSIDSDHCRRIRACYPWVPRPSSSFDDGAGAGVAVYHTGKCVNHVRHECMNSALQLSRFVIIACRSGLAACRFAQWNPCCDTVAQPLAYVGGRCRAWAHAALMLDTPSPIFAQANYFLLNYATLASFTTLLSNVLLLQLPDRFVWRRVPACPLPVQRDAVPAPSSTNFGCQC